MGRGPKPRTVDASASRLGCKVLRLSFISSARPLASWLTPLPQGVTPCTSLPQRSSFLLFWTLGFTTASGVLGCTGSHNKRGSATRPNIPIKETWVRKGRDQRDTAG